MCDYFGTCNDVICRNVVGKITFSPTICRFCGVREVMGVICCEKAKAYNDLIKKVVGKIEFTSPTSDPINFPAHYTSSKAKCVCGRTIECIDITRHFNSNLGNAIKYIWRCDLKKDAIEDLRKSIFYLNNEIQKRIEEKKND